MAAPFERARVNSRAYGTAFHQVLVTPGIARLAQLDQALIFHEVYRKIETAHVVDSGEEIDFGLLCVAAQDIIFKIDTYTNSPSAINPDESSAAMSRRVLTIMLADEY